MLKIDINSGQENCNGRTFKHRQNTVEFFEKICHNPIHKLFYSKNLIEFKLRKKLVKTVITEQKRREHLA
jgi:hypothetical protein